MSERARRRRDFLQNITIVLLALTAVLLFALTQMNSLGTGFLQLFSGGDLPVSDARANGGTPALTAPVRVAVSGPFGRYGSVTLTTDSEDFAPLRGLLGQALSGGRSFAGVDSQAFLDALEGTSVYYDFLTPLPLPVLANLLQSEGEEPEHTARRLLVAERGNGVAVYLWDESARCFRCDTDLPQEMLEEAVSRYELGGAYFAFESEDPNAASAAACSLFLSQLPELPVLSASSSPADTGLLLSRLGFNPNTQNRYLDASGAEVVIERGSSLRLRSDGVIVYQSRGEAALSISAAEELPTQLEAVTQTAALLHDLLSGSAGDASLYLESVRQVGGATVLKFGYQAGGVPIRFTDGKSAAQVSLSGTRVTAITLRVRQYTATGETSLLLPLRQALAIAAREEGAELSLGYTDSGDGVVAANWLAE